jgi:aspartate carbamoyltransferase catalytic subunit
MAGFKGRSIISLRDFNKDEILHVLESTAEVDSNRKKYSDVMKGKILATLFYEPSTRTRLSFESAMLRLGGQIIGFADPSLTSAKKGESLADSIKMCEAYSDIIVLRSKIEGAARLASNTVNIPVINGGDGANQHPTQTFLDLFTIKKSKDTLENLKVGFMGDLKYGRTVHSLAYALSFFNAKMSFISPKDLRMPEDHLEELNEKGVDYAEVEDFGDVKKDLDVLYVTRIQKERFGDQLDYARVAEGYFINKKFLEGCNPELKILHPLPRVDELSRDVDSTPHAVYFEQAANGIPTRMALICLTMGVIK